jgi:hypothetical protein
MALRMPSSLRMRHQVRNGGRYVGSSVPITVRFMSRMHNAH